MKYGRKDREHYEGRKSQTRPNYLQKNKTGLTAVLRSFKNIQTKFIIFIDCAKAMQPLYIPLLPVVQNCQIG